jgi:Flp pilus assembly pilin Flp
MRQWLWTLWCQDDGQDVIEYTLLLAAILFLTIGLVAFGGQSIKGIVNRSNSQLSAANDLVPG